MIFYLTDSLRIKDSDTESYKKILRHSLRNIAVSAIENSHGIFGDFDILKDCVEIFKGDEELYGYFRHLLDNWYSMPVPQCITYYVEVVRDNPNERIIGNCTIAQRVIGDFSEQASTHPCNLVCEDDIDCTFYRYLVGQYIRHKNINANVKYHNDGCGGCGHAIDKVRVHLSLKQVCLCILDSDKAYPEKDINKEAKPCIRLDKHICGYKCVVLAVHEVENLLPLNYVIPAVKDSPDYSKHESCRDQVRHFEYLKNSQIKLEILPYYDYKNGIKWQEEILKDRDYMRFAEKCWSEDPELSSGGNFKTYVNQLGKGDSICYRLSRTVLEDTMMYIDKQKMNNITDAPNLLPFQAHEWERIGQELLNWGYSGSVETVS